MLLEEGDQIVRSFDVGVVARALLAELEMYLTEERDDAVYLKAAICDVNGVRVLLPAEIVSFLRREGRRLKARGVTLPPLRGLAIDLDSGLAGPVDPLLGDPDELVGDGKISPSGLTTSIDVVCSMRWRESVAELSVAEAAQQLGSLATNLGRTAKQGLGTLVEVAAGARRIELPPLNSRETLSALVGAVDGRRGTDDVHKTAHSTGGRA
jgi:hypothetical protein